MHDSFHNFANRYWYFPGSIFRWLLLYRGFISSGRVYRVKAWLNWYAVDECVQYSWVSLGYFAVNLSGGQPKMYWWLCCTGVKKIPRNCTYLLPNTRSRMQWKTFPPTTVHRFGVHPQWNYDVTWNPRIYVIYLLLEVNYSLNRNTVVGLT